ncbi:MAG: glycosyltransferase family 39 protein [Candidatus Promineifilaceae bacterium]|nr:glycosyltransferase family 39 protein [Candidatus Promineifilaceae bacterium]
MKKLSAALGVVLLAAFLRLFQLASVPFGWHPDEATKALLARDVLAGKYFPVFFSAFTGREALFVYLEALLFALIGEGIFVGRFLSALIGILTVALTYRTGREWFNWRIGLLAAAFLAVSLWHLIASRNGYRAVIQPLIQLPVLLLLFHGLRAQNTDSMVTRSTWYFVMAGFFLGLTQYTYTAVRLFPFLIVIIVILAWIFDRRRVKDNWFNLALMALVAFLVFLPLGYYFWQNPQDFFGRAAQISVFSPEWAGGDSGARLWQSVKETARMWMIWGDINYRFNISGQPVFDQLTGLLFLFGILISVRRAFLTHEIRCVAYLSLFFWVGLMLLPMILSAESLPYYQRAIGALPAVYFFPAITLDAALDFFDRRDNRRLIWASAAVLIAFFCWLTISSYQDYFVDWHNAQRNDDDRRVAMVYVADYLQESELDTTLYVSTQYMQHPTLALLAPDSYDGIHWFDARQSLPLPLLDEEAHYVLLSENEPQPALLNVASGLQHLSTETDRFGRPVFELFRWQGTDYPGLSDEPAVFWSWATRFEADTLQDSFNAIDLPVDFDGVMQLLGYDQSDTELAAGDTLELILHWQLGEKPPRQYTIFAHLLAADGQVVAGFDANEYPTSFWKEDGGEHLLSYMPLSLGSDLPPGEYQLEVGVYNQPTGERLMILDGGEAVADRILLAPIKVR